MIGMELAKRSFFDGKAVMAHVDEGTRRALSRFAAFVRRDARQSIRKRRSPSKPGQPPSSHTGLLKRFIFFAYEFDRHNVVIGPVRLSGVTGEAPPALEYGGLTTPTGQLKNRRQNWRLAIGGHGPIGGRDGQVRYIRIRTAAQLAKVKSFVARESAKGASASFLSAADRQRAAKKRLRIAARPFMQPAFDRNLGQLPAIWASATK